MRHWTILIYSVLTGLCVPNGLHVLKERKRTHFRLHKTVVFNHKSRREIPQNGLKLERDKK